MMVQRKKKNAPTLRKGKPIVLVIGGHDPTSAGIHADIETCAANRCLALTAVTGLTAQNTSNFHQLIATDPHLVLRQLDSLLEEFVPDAVKIGLLPTNRICIELAGYISRHLNGIPIVLDPVFRTGGSDTTLTDEKVPDTIVKYLLPLVTVLTPNRDELSILASNKNIDIAAEKILGFGTKAILATDLGYDNHCITNVLRTGRTDTIKFVMERYQQLSHGTGCTLSSAIACGLARGKTINQSLTFAQQYTHETVRNSLYYDVKQTLPNRLYKL